MRSSNPVLKESLFTSPSGALMGSAEEAQIAASRMSVEGTMLKTAMLLITTATAASYTWDKFTSLAKGGLAGSNFNMWLLGGMIVGFILAMVITFKPKLAPVLAFPYAIAEGLFLGAISAVYAQNFSGEQAIAGLGGSIVFQAVALTFAVAIGMFGLYYFRVIKVTAKLRSIVIAATTGIFIFYILSFVLGFFGIQVPLIHSSGMFGIGFSLFVIGLAAFNLLLDFDLIERGSASGAPKYMEWYGAVALLITLVWLYIEILRLLGKLRSSD